MKTRFEILAELRHVLEQINYIRSDEQDVFEEKVWAIALDLAQQAAALPKYFAHSFSEHNVYMTIVCHWIYFVAHSPDLLKALLAGDFVSLWRQDADGQILEVVLTVEPGVPSEGEFSLLYRVDGRSIYTLSFTVAPGHRFGVEDSEVLFVTRMQGHIGRFEDIRRAAQEMADITPQALLFTVARALAAACDLRRIVALRGQDQLSFVLPLSSIFENQYDHFMSSIGGELLTSAFFSIDATMDLESRRAHKSKHVARAMRKRRVKAAIFGEVIEVVRSRFLAGRPEDASKRKRPRDHNLTQRERRVRRRSILRVGRGLRLISQDLNRWMHTHQGVLSPGEGFLTNKQGVLNNFRALTKIDDIYRESFARGWSLDYVRHLFSAPLDDSDGDFSAALRNFLMRQPYQTQPPDQATARTDPQTVLRDALFDPEYYLSVHPDVRAAGCDPVGHYLDYGARERRNPNPYFSTILYCAENPEVVQSGINPLVHYALLGAAQGRRGVHRV